MPVAIKLTNLKEFSWYYKAYVNALQTAGIRAVKAMLQTGAALLVIQMPGGTVDWVSVGSAALLVGIAFLGTSVAGLPELEKQEDG